jgi:hypothetical protein
VILVAVTAMMTSEISLLGTLSPRDVLFPAVWGCVGNGIVYVFWTRANRLAREQGVGVAAIASAMFILPLLALTIVALLLGETQLLHPYFAVSLALILLGSVLCQKASAIAALAIRQPVLAPEKID